MKFIGVFRELTAALFLTLKETKHWEQRMIPMILPFSSSASLAGIEWWALVGLHSCCQCGVQCWSHTNGWRQGTWSWLGHVWLVRSTWAGVKVEIESAELLGAVGKENMKTRGLELLSEWKAAFRVSTTRQRVMPPEKYILCTFSKYLYWTSRLGCWNRAIKSWMYSTAFAHLSFLLKINK